ncbi:putative selenate ABC transporter substrate-binding protein [filamentous cyanobacterium CCP5]|nr:putative selenate ABC transporter substrate-binding protein [filamentous cyanobacterium CCP5]
MLRRSFLAGIAGILLLLSLTACGGSGSSGEETTEPLTVGAIPDQDPEQVQRLYALLADYLDAELGVPVEYEPVTDYAAAVTAFKVGDLDLVWFGGLTGVQARLQVDGAEAIAQRPIDEQFHSVFIANTSSGLAPISDISDLTVLRGHSFTFGSESSTSGRLMPQYFMQQAEVSPADFKGEVGFSGNHDSTIKLVEAGTYEVGALNEQVWESRLEEGAIDTSKVQVIWRTPAYYDYHWVIHPSVEDRYGEGFIDQVQAAILALDPSVPEEKEILDLFGAEKFIPTENENYAQIEAIGREIGKIQ